MRARASSPSWLRVFRQFWRGGNSRRRGGTGLGLFIVKGLVEAHGGAITVQRAPEGGAELFTVPTGTPDFATLAIESAPVGGPTRLFPLKPWIRSSLLSVYDPVE